MNWNTGYSISDILYKISSQHSIDNFSTFVFNLFLNLLNMVEMQQTTLKVIVIVHFILSVWASMVYLPPSYIYMNAGILAFAVWAIICPESIDAILLYFILNVTSIVMDIIFISIFATLAEGAGLTTGLPTSQASTAINTYRFSLGMSILNLILKPLSCYMLYRLYQDRAGLTHFPQVLNYARPHGYDVIDQPTPPSAVETAMPYTQVEKRPVA